jgi:DNA-binding LytR/AlgR family response regulator
MKALIVDDELNARLSLRGILKKILPEIRIVMKVRTSFLQ